MDILKAKYKHIPEINTLIGMFHTHTINKHHLYPDSVSYVILDKGKVRGFVWAGIFAHGTQAYVDHYVVHPTLSGSKAGLFLIITLAQELLKRGVTKAFSVIEEQNVSSFPSAVRNYQLGGELLNNTFKIFNFSPDSVTKAIGK